MFDLQHTCKGIVLRVTGETLTKYNTLARNLTTKIIWTQGMSRELGRLSQLFLDEKGTDTVKFMTYEQIDNIPRYRMVTYAFIVVYYCLQKSDPNGVRITAEGNLISYPNELTKRITVLVTTKILWNSMLSTHDAKYMCVDIKIMYLATPMDRFEYM